MSDITLLFKATIKAVKSRQKAQGVNVGVDKSILGPKKNRTAFSTKSKEVVNNITKLKEFLLKHRKDYVNASNHVGENSHKMTDKERDQIDSDAETFMRTCSEAIKLFKREVNQEGNKVDVQIKEHRDWVLSFIEHYLKAICQLYSEQRAVRVKRVVDRKRISRLHPENRRPAKRPLLSIDDKSQLNGEGKKESEDSTSATKDHKRRMLAEQPTTSLSFDVSDDELSPEEVQIFEQENKQLYEEMNSMVDEVKHIEGKVVEISRLQEIFADKVLEQEKDIDRIGDTVVGTTENIKEANEEIREAMKNNAGVRVWILFFLIVCSFSLLFLDWYND